MPTGHHLAVTVDELRWFLVLAETQNVTKAAELLNVTQPTLSRALRRLERQIGAPLFDRAKQRVHLNANGRIMRAHAQRAVQEISRAGDVIATLMAPSPGVVRLSFLHSLGPWLVPDLLGRFREVDPHTRFVLHQDSACDVLASVHEDRADLALTSPRPPDPLLEWQALQTQRLVLAVPNRHPLAGRSRVRLAELVEERLIAMRSGYGLRQITEDLFRRRGLTPAVAMESSEIQTILGLVARGLGVAVVPGGRGGPVNADITIVDLDDEYAYRSIGLCWHADRPAPPAVRRFRHFVADRQEADPAE